MTIKAKLELVGFKKFGRIMEPSRFNNALRKHVSLATRRGALLVRKEIRRSIKKGVAPKNAPLTRAIKGSSKPLVDKGDLWQAISIEQPDFGTAFIGVKRTDENYDVARALHEGVSIKVTPKMRGLFHILWLASVARREGKPIPPLTGRAAQLFARFQDWKPLKQDTQVIRIPARPFIADTFGRQDVKDGVIQQWNKAIASAFAEIRRG